MAERGYSARLGKPRAVVAALRRSYASDAGSGRTVRVLVRSFHRTNEKAPACAKVLRCLVERDYSALSASPSAGQPRAVVAALRRSYASDAGSGRTVRVLVRLFTAQTKKPQLALGLFCLSGGERGIRTLDTRLTYTHFPGVLLQPLGHLSGSRRQETLLPRRANVPKHPCFGKPFFYVFQSLQWLADKTRQS